MTEKDHRKIKIPKPVKFSYQKSERFQPLVDNGFAENLSESGLCWLACWDIATSAYLEDDNKRFELVKDIAFNARNLGMILPYGGISTGNEEKEKSYIDSTNLILKKYSIPLRIERIDISSPEDIIDEMRKGNMLFLAVDIEAGHIILMDKIYKDLYQKEEILSYWDTAVPDPVIGHFFMPANQNVFVMFDGQKHYSAILGPNAYSLKRTANS